MAVPEVEAPLPSGDAEEVSSQEPSSAKHQPSLVRQTTSHLSAGDPPNKAAIKRWKSSTLKVTMSARLAKSETESSVKLMIENEMTNMPILQSLNPSFITFLAAGITPRLYGRGETIAKQGAPGTSLIFVLRGTVDVWIGSEKVAALATSQSFGEANLLGLENQWVATLCARDRCEVCEFMRDHWEQTLQIFPDEKIHFDNIVSATRPCLSDGTLTKTVKLLQGLSDITLNTVDVHVVCRLYFPGEKIIVEGQPGDECYILVQGRAQVEIGGRRVRSEGCGFTGALSEENQLTRRNSFYHWSNDPVCFGELGFFGMHDVRTATVVAETTCQVRILYRSVFLKALTDHGESLHLQEMNQFMENRYHGEANCGPAKTKLREIPFFEEDCSDEFFDFLATNLEDRVFLKGQPWKPEENSLYILTKGVVTVLKNGVRITSQTEGSVFGSIPALGLGSNGDTSSRISYESAETCFLQVLHQACIIRALELFPEERQKVLMMAFRSEESLNAEEIELPIPKRERRASAKAGSAPGSSRKLTAASKNTSEELSAWKSQTRKAFMRAMQKSQLFKDVSVAFLEHLSAVSVDRIYMPGDLIIEEGKRGESMFIMVSGSAGVFARDSSDPDVMNGTISVLDHDHALHRKRSKGAIHSVLENAATTRIGMLTAGSISGELAMLGVSQTRSATIRAETLCSMWEITQENALSILSAFPEVNRQFAAIVLERLERTAPSRVLQLSLFQSFDRKFRMLLGLYCDKRAYFPSQRILHEGRHCDGMYVVNMGVATLEKSTISIKMYSPGMHFGSTVMLGIHKKSIGSLVALQTCHILVITHTNFGLALEKYPCHQSYLDFKKSELAEYEQFQKAIQRISARKLVWRRYQRAGAGGEDPDKKISDKALLTQTIQVWKRFTDQSSRERVRIVARRQKAVQWIEWKRDAVQKRREQDIAQTVARNADAREPLGNIHRAFGGRQSPLSSKDRTPSPRSPVSSSHMRSDEAAAARVPVAPLPKLQSVTLPSPRPSPFLAPVVRNYRPRRIPPHSFKLPNLMGDAFAPRCTDGFEESFTVNSARPLGGPQTHMQQLAEDTTVHLEDYNVGDTYAYSFQAGFDDFGSFQFDPPNKQPMRSMAPSKRVLNLAGQVGTQVFWPGADM